MGNGWSRFRVERSYGGHFKIGDIWNGEIEKDRAKSRDVQASCFVEENDEQ